VPPLGRGAVGVPVGGVGIVWSVPAIAAVSFGLPFSSRLDGRIKQLPSFFYFVGSDFIAVRIFNADAAALRTKAAVLGGVEEPGHPAICVQAGQRAID